VLVFEEDAIFNDGDLSDGLSKSIFELAACDWDLFYLG